MTPKGLGGLCSKSPGDATYSPSSSITQRPDVLRRPEHNNRRGVTKQSKPQILMYPKLMFNEYAIFRLVHAKSENGFIVLLLKGACVCVCREACSVVLTRSKCVCQSVFTSVCRVPDKCIH